MVRGGWDFALGARGRDTHLASKHKVVAILLQFWQQLLCNLSAVRALQTVIGPHALLILDPAGVREDQVLVDLLVMGRRERDVALGVPVLGESVLGNVFCAHLRRNNNVPLVRAVVEQVADDGHDIIAARNVERALRGHEVVLHVDDDECRPARSVRCHIGSSSGV